jgi:type I restriction enzyme S subunit
VTNKPLKETEIGSIPHNWEVVRLSEIAQVRYGLGQPPEIDPNGIPIIRATDLKQGRIIADTVLRVKREAIPPSRNAYLQPGEIIVVRSGAYTGDVAEIPKEWAGAVAGYDLIITPTDKVIPSFLAFYLRGHVAQRFFRSQRDRSAQPHLNRQQLLSTLVPLPTRNEQRVIAVVLDKLQAAIAAQQAIIDRTAELKAALMAKLFTEGLHGESTTETPNGTMPNSWDLVALGEVITQAQYGLSVRGEPEGKYPILRMNCQRDGRVWFRDLQYVNIDAATFAAFRLKDGDILFNRTNSIDLVGRTAIFRLRHDAVFASYLIRLRTDGEKLLPDFLNYFFNMDRTQKALKQLASRGVSQSNISASKLKTFLIPIPPLGEQQEMVSILATLDEKLRFAEARLALYQELFSAMLNELMTGQIRVQDIDTQALEIASHHRPSDP